MHFFYFSFAILYTIIATTTLAVIAIALLIRTHPKELTGLALISGTSGVIAAGLLALHPLALPAGLLPLPILASRAWANYRNS